MPMNYPIVQNLIPGLPKIPYRHGIGAYEGVVNHSTATPNATDEAERNYEANNWNNAFVHFFVDWDSITQVADTTYTAWGAGPVANNRFVHVELCETSDPTLFKESYNRYVFLVAKLLKDKNLGVTDHGTLWSHAEVTQLLGGTTHEDPIQYLASHGVTWAQHVSNVLAEYNSYFVSVAKRGVVKALVNKLNVRKGPGTNFPVAFQMNINDAYNFYDVKDGWYCISTDRWVFSNKGQYLEVK